MTSHERFNSVLNKCVPDDRLPVDLLWPRQETLDALMEYFNTNSVENVFRKLGVDFRWINLCIRYPEFEKKVNGILEGVVPSSGGSFIFHDASTFENQWGVIMRVGDDGKYEEWKNGPLVGKETLDNWAPPEMVLPSVEAVRKELKPYRDYVTVTEIAFPFKIAWHICGYEHFMMQMILNPDFVDKLYDVLYEVATKKALLAAVAGYDVVALVGDVAGQNGMMFSPVLFRQFDVPRLSKLVESVLEKNPNIKILYHSDGDMEAVIPHLIECGIHIINPVQSACMDPAEIKKNYGGHLTFHGTISVQDTIPNGTVEDVKNEVAERIKTVGYNGGFIISNENVIPYNAPLENILALYEAAGSLK
jgi:hypothetical protein